MIRFIAIESFLIACLAILSAYLFWVSAGALFGSNTPASSPSLFQRGPELIIFALVIACGVPIAAYWLLQMLGMMRLAFWSVTMLTLALEAPAVFAHNGIDWLPFRFTSWLTTGLDAPTVTCLLLSSLVLLVTLHRVADLRRLYASLGSLRIDHDERRSVMVNEVMVLGILVGSSLAVAVALLAGGLALAELDSVLGRSPWTVLTVGAAALSLLGYFLYVWIRRQETD